MFSQKDIDGYVRSVIEEQKDFIKESTISVFDRINKNSKLKERLKGYLMRKFKVSEANPKFLSDYKLVWNDENFHYKMDKDQLKFYYELDDIGFTLYNFNENGSGVLDIDTTRALKLELKKGLKKKDDDTDK